MLLTCCRSFGQRAFNIQVTTVFSFTPTNGKCWAQQEKEEGWDKTKGGSCHPGGYKGKCSVYTFDVLPCPAPWAVDGFLCTHSHAATCSERPCSTALWWLFPRHTCSAWWATASQSQQRFAALWVPIATTPALSLPSTVPRTRPPRPRRRARRAPGPAAPVSGTASPRPTHLVSRSVVAAPSQLQLLKKGNCFIWPVRPTFVYTASFWPVQSAAPASKAALRGSQNAVPAMKSALQHKVLRLPRNLQTSHMSKSHDSLYLSQNQNASKTPPCPRCCTCHEICSLK